MTLSTGKRTVLIGMLALVGISACSESTTSPSGNMRVEASIKASSVHFGKVVMPGGVLHGGNADSLRISSVKLMVSEIKLHRSGGGEDNVKTGPALLVVDQTGVRSSISATIGATTVDKIKLKFHRLNDEEIKPLQGNADFADFVTADRPTVIIEGTAYDDGEATSFKYAAKVEDDLLFDLTDFGVTSDGLTTIVVEFDPVAVFKDKSTGLVMNPVDVENHLRIDDAIKTTLNLIKK